MIFVYPAIISGSVDSKIGSAVAKVLEQYFLLHIQEAIQNNEIRIVTKWQSKGIGDDNGTYGPLTLQTERKKIEGNIILENGYGDKHAKKRSDENRKEDESHQSSPVNENNPPQLAPGNKSAPPPESA